MARPQLRIQYRDPAHLKPRPTNPRTHTPRQLKQIAASIHEFGFVNPVLIDGQDGIVAGHARVEAAKSIGMTDVPTVRVDHLSQSQIRAYVIADNRLAELAGWDRGLLAIELQELSVELNFDVTVTGFETAEIDLVISEGGAETPDPLDDVPPIDRSAPAVSRLGDLWKIGDHYLLCGDALKPESFEQLLQGRKAQMVFTDPPYNVPVVGHVSGKGKTIHREFPMASGEMTSPAFEKFLKKVLANLFASSYAGAIHFVCMDWRHVRELSNAAFDLKAELKNICVWAKSNGGMGSLYRSQHELIFVLKSGGGKHINNVELGRYGRNRTNIWNYAGANSFGKERSENLEMHPTTKPVAMVSDAILDCSRRGGRVLDAFAGSGTTLLAAEQTGRKGFGLELDPAYVDLTLRRLEEATGLMATHIATGLSSSELKLQRGKMRGFNQTSQDDTSNETQTIVPRRRSRQSHKKS